MRTTARPLIPTGRPPTPGMPSVNTNTSSWSTSMKTTVPGLDRSTPSPCASWISRPISTPSWAEFSGNCLSRRRARTANVPDAPLVSAMAAEAMASGVLATRSGRHTRTMPGTSHIRSASWRAAWVQAASPRCSPSATRSRMTPSRWRMVTGRSRLRTAARMLPCRIFSNCCRFRPLSTISPSLSRTQGSSGPCGRTSSCATGNCVTPLVCQPEMQMQRDWQCCLPGLFTGLFMAALITPGALRHEGSRSG